MADTLEQVIADLHQTERVVSSADNPARPRWPVIVLRSPKG